MKDTVLALLCYFKVEREKNNRENVHLRKSCGTKDKAPNRGTGAYPGVIYMCDFQVSWLLGWVNVTLADSRSES